MDLLSPSFGLLIWTLLSFLIVFFLLKKFAWQAIIKGLNDREKNIADSISTEKVRAEMAQLKNDNEILLGKAREERALMLKEAKETKDKIIGEAREQAKVEAAKIISNANEAITNQKLAALTDLKNQVGILVLDVSEKILRRELNNKDEHEKYIKQLAEEVKFDQ